jgi:hypothetical protein
MEVVLREEPVFFISQPRLISSMQGYLDCVAMAGVEIEMVLHEGSGNDGELEFLLFRYCCFYGDLRVFGLLPCAQDCEDVGRTFKDG